MEDLANHSQRSFDRLSYYYNVGLDFESRAFVYTSLPSGHIWLLHISPVHRPSTTLSCKLKVFSLQDRHKYKDLSYAGGWRKHLSILLVTTGDWTSRLIYVKGSDVVQKLSSSIGFKLTLFALIKMITRKKLPKSCKCSRFILLLNMSSSGWGESMASALRTWQLAVPCVEKSTSKQWCIIGPQVTVGASYLVLKRT